MAEAAVIALIALYLLVVVIRVVGLWLLVPNG